MLMEVTLVFRSVHAIKQFCERRDLCQDQPLKLFDTPSMNELMQDKMALAGPLTLRYQAS